MTSETTVIPSEVLVDNTTIEKNSSSQLQIKDGGVSDDKLETQNGFIGEVKYRAGNITGTPAVPDNWQICDGSVINNALSPMNGQNTPNLIDKFVRGSATAGVTSGSDTHTHNTAGGIGGSHIANSSNVTISGSSGTVNQYTASGSNVPTFITLQPYIRIY